MAFEKRFLQHRGISVLQKLGMVAEYVVGAFRTMIQLLVAGYILGIYGALACAWLLGLVGA